ncbi:metal-dependent transcriptional regulator [Ferruginibacter sp. SUN106]|uniref:metal-dependent transcriptional regulator n=1 Tax=Ferruginibacter sp. SUN106 TaxID=2978348 RepID=UPI003D36A4D3
MNFSESEENYIKSIYHLQQDTGLVNTNALAAEMQTKAASVTDMLKKLAAKKILQYEKYKGFKLTDNGKKVALTVVRKHRLWEYFLVEKLGFEWDKVHDIAEELEHISSNELIEKLQHFLGNPSFDPHGDPIPDSNGKIPKLQQQNLTSLPLNKTALVSSVSNQSPQMLEMLKHYSIAIGTSIKLLKKFEFDGSLEIKVSKQPACIISEQIAKNIFVHYD